MQRHVAQPQAVAILQGRAKSGSDALSTMVSCGLGVGVMPEAVAIRHGKTIPLHIVRISDESATRGFLLGVRSLEALPAAARLMVEHLLRVKEPGS